MKKINVLIADDHPAFREGLSQLIKEETDLEVIAATGYGEEAVEIARKLHPDVVILDISMPGVNGIKAAEQIRKRSPSTAILMVSAFSYKAYVLGSLRAGAMGYLSKSSPLNKLITAIRMVYAGQQVFDLSTISRILFRSSRRIGAHKFPIGLHPREVQILKLVAKGVTNPEIGDHLGMKERTVQSYMASILNKLGVNSRTGAVLQALKEGWLSPEDLVNTV